MKVSILRARGDGHEVTPLGEWREVILADLLSKPAAMRRVKTIVGWRGKRTFVIDEGDAAQLRCHDESDMYVVRF